MLILKLQLTNLQLQLQLTKMREGVDDAVWSRCVRFVKRSDKTFVS